MGLLLHRHGVFSLDVDFAETISFGFFTDLHHNPDKPSSVLVNGTRYFADAEEKLDAAVAEWNSQGVDFVMFGGDYIDTVGETSAAAIADLGTIEDNYSALTMPRYYVLGNHDFDALTTAEFISNSGMTDEYYSFDVGGVRFIVLNACYNTDDDNDPYDTTHSFTTAFVPPAQRAFLTSELSSAPGGAIVFCHQQLSGTRGADYTVNNAAAVRAIMEAAGNVVAVFGGHEHVPDSVTVNGIGYYVMEAMVDGANPTNAYAVCTYYRTGSYVVVDGYGNQPSYGTHPYSGVAITTPEIVESFPTGVVFASLYGTGGGGSATFAEITDTDGKFEIVNGNQIRLTSALDFSVSTSHTLGIRLTNADTSTVDVNVTINVIEDNTDMAKISKTTLANQATADIAIPAGYDIFRLTGWMKPATDGSVLRLTTSSNAGVSYDSGASDYQWDADDSLKDSADTFMRLHAFSSGNSTNEQIEFSLDMIPTDGANHPTSFSGLVTRIDTNGGIDKHAFVGRRLSNTTVDSIRFAFDSGNIASGELFLEGLPSV